MPRNSDSNALWRQDQLETLNHASPDIPPKVIKSAIIDLLLRYLTEIILLKILTLGVIHEHDVRRTKI
jgi:hypothetical protein